ncbi:hypothetical protein DFR69_11699 [Nocardia neocaledoniensis]|uniref:Uncharacterized protein n=1 Tax=Nocardia neocaledoniensis TaxID=236511 RepID=A0A317N302_9NOCA|nr:hypothetical protein DFR69_11699 [Nocardia neocaledoniensis]
MRGVVFNGDRDLEVAEFDRQAGGKAVIEFCTGAS